MSYNPLMTQASGETRHCAAIDCHLTDAAVTEREGCQRHYGCSNEMSLTTAALAADGNLKSYLRYDVNCHWFQVARN